LGYTLVDGPYVSDHLPAAEALPEAPASPHQVFGWFNRMLPESFFQSLKQDRIVKTAAYTPTVTTADPAAAVEWHAGQCSDHCRRLRASC
jgi:hypothetical protein